MTEIQPGKQTCKMYPANELINKPGRFSPNENDERNQYRRQLQYFRSPTGEMSPTDWQRSSVHPSPLKSPLVSRSMGGVDGGRGGADRVKIRTS